jgi:hypothetical protein
MTFIFGPYELQSVKPPWGFDISANSFMRAFNAPGLIKTTATYGWKVTTRSLYSYEIGLVPWLFFALLHSLLSLRVLALFVAVLTLPEIRASRSEFADAGMLAISPAHIRAQ